MADVMMSIIFVKLNLQKTVSSPNFFFGSRPSHCNMTRNQNCSLSLFSIYDSKYLSFMFENLCDLSSSNWICRKPFLHLTFLGASRPSHCNIARNQNCTLSLFSLDDWNIYCKSSIRSPPCIISNPKFPRLVLEVFQNL